MKLPVSKHQENLSKLFESYNLKLKAHIQTQMELEKMVEEIEFRELQIKEATKQHKTSFDSEKFLVKRK